MLLRRTFPRQIRQFSSSSFLRKENVLITGSLGQLGFAFSKHLKEKGYNVVASDVRAPPPSLAENFTQPWRPAEENENTFPYVHLDILNPHQLEATVVQYRINTIIHFSALLSAVGEQFPELAMKVNLEGFQNVLNTCKQYQCRLFVPSTIGAFGPSTPKVNTPDVTIMRPNTIYGITKLHAELMGEYYYRRYNVDFRSLRYPGIISADSQPGGGTTDFAVEIFHDAVANKPFTCYLKPDTRLPMMYLSDCVEGTLKFLEASNESLPKRTYNITATSFTPKELGEAIKKRIPTFQMEYTKEVDRRQSIADSWPESLDDSDARKDWGWSPKYDTDGIVDIMLSKLKKA